MKKQTLFISLILTSSLILLVAYLFVFFYQIEETNIKKTIEEYFPQAIVKEVFKRVEDNNILNVSAHRPDKEKLEKPMLITTKDTIKIQRTPEYEELNREEKESIFLQTIMRWENHFIVLEDVNDIWTDLLKNKNIIIKTGVKYRCRDEAPTYYSNADSLFFMNSFRVNEYYTGLFKEFTFQGYYQYSFLSVYNYNPIKFVLLSFVEGFFFLIFLIILYHLHFLRKKNDKIQKEQEYLIIKSCSINKFTSNSQESNDS